MAVPTPRDSTGAAGAGTSADRLVVMGASAGGIEALSVVVAGLPRTFPAPIVIAQHLHPDHPSSLVEILARRTEMRVVEIFDRMPLRPGNVYIVPPDRHVAVSDHEIRLDPDHHGRPKPSVDLLFETASEVFAERLIGVVLSGTGSDGAAGAQVVAAAGGTIIAQDPETASFPSMPRSLLPQSVDAVVRVEAIAGLLQSLVTTGGSLKDDDQSVDQFLAQLRDRSGIDFTAYKRPTILRRLERRIAATKSASLADYRRYLLLHPEEIHRLTSSLLIKVTEFFRDPKLYAELRETIIPRLIDGAAQTRELRIWSAGCATGEEPYSVAMLLADALHDAGQWTLRIFATDADPEAIAFARRGVYPASSLASLDEGIRARHFRLVDGEYEMSQQIRAMTIFGEHDLAQRAPFPRIDLVLCRNVLIYFTPELQRRALQLFAFSLRDGGFLALGKSESVNPQPAAFVTENAALRIYRRAGQRSLLPSQVLGDVPQVNSRGRPARRTATHDAPLSLRELPRLVGPAERAETVLLRLPVGVIVVNAAYDTEFLNTAARTLLGVHGAAIGEDFIHQARALPSDQLRSSLDRALAGEPIEAEFDVTTETPIGSARRLRLSLAPLIAPGAGSGARTGRQYGPRPGESELASGTPAASALVLVTDVSAEHETLVERTSDAARDAAELGRLRAQAERLTGTNAELLRGNEELAILNAQLRTANEELMVYNEELQAASEEVETLNEELQATNEELETLNEELQATVEELNAANEDLAARSASAVERAPRSGIRRPRVDPPLTLLPPGGGDPATEPEGDGDPSSGPAG